MFALNFKTHYNSKDKIWRGNKEISTFNPDVSVGQVLLRTLNFVLDKVVQINDGDGRTLTGRELKLLSIRAAQNLQNHVASEEVIGIVASNTHFLAPLVFGAFIAGVPINPVDPTFNKDEMKHMFNITRPKLIFCDDNVYDTVKESIAEINLKCPVFLMNGCRKGAPFVDEMFKKCGDEEMFIPPVLEKGGNHILAIICSSGTTGLPKGICMSHKSMLRQSESIFSADEVAVSFNTLYWMSGLMILIIGTISGFTRIITHEPFSPELMLRIIEQYKVSLLFTPPAQMALAIKSSEAKRTNWSSVKNYFCGGSAVPTVMSNAMQDCLKNGAVHVGYGMSEISGIITLNHKNKKLGSVGQVCPFMEVKIIDDDGKYLGIGEQGEICIRPEYKCIGYLGDPEANKATFDADGWVHSGDFAYFDNDGYLFIVERKTEILKYKGIKYAPSEIESLIMQIPDVKEVCVFGMPDIIATDLPTAVVVKKEGSSLTKDDISEYVANNMANFKHLRGGVFFVNSIPRTPSGKIKRRDVKKMFLNSNDNNVI